MNFIWIKYTPPRCFLGAGKFAPLLLNEIVNAASSKEDVAQAQCFSLRSVSIKCLPQSIVQVHWIKGETTSSSYVLWRTLVGQAFFSHLVHIRWQCHLEQWGKCCLKSCNCPVCFVSPQNGPWLCQKEAHVFHETWVVEKDMFSMGLFHLSNMDLSLDTKRGKQKVGRILLYVTMQLARNWIDVAFHSVDFFRTWQLCLLLLWSKNGHMHKQPSKSRVLLERQISSPYFPKTFRLRFYWTVWTSSRMG